MEYLMALIIFCSVLFLYLHIHFHLKTSNDLEIYTIDHPSKEKLEEICDLRQPVTFRFDNDMLTSICTLDHIIKDYGSFDINVRNNTEDDCEMSEPYLPLSLNQAIKLFQKDTESKYFTEKNEDFIKETGLLRTFCHNDLFFRPPLVSKCEYDFCAGSRDCTTPLRYSVNYRNFLYVTHGEIQIKLIPPTSSKYLRPIEDYDNFEFRSPINAWNVQEEYKKDFGKVKALELSLKPNDIIFIPAYWWYSIKYGEKANICCFRYRTYMNTVAILPSLIISTLQILNTKHNIVERIG